MVWLVVLRLQGEFDPKAISTCPNIRPDLIRPNGISAAIA
jgi:hypothetical protein